MELNGINQKNILNITRELCEKANIIMTIWRNTTLPFFEEKLLLPYKCQSIIEEELRIKAENNKQTVLC